MARIHKRPYNVKIIEEKTEREEFGPGKPGVWICRQCYCFYYEKAWHHDPPGKNMRKNSETGETQLTVCPACQMAQNRLFEGEIIIHAIPSALKEQLVTLINSFGERAFRRDCQDRLTIVADEDGLVRVTTTENQTAGKLARKIKQVFNKLTVRISFSRQPDDLERITIAFA